LSAIPEGTGRGAWALTAAALLAALTCLVFAPALAPDRVFYFRDISQNHHPFRELTTSLIGQGDLPLWNPYRGAGQPLLANPNALVLHPTTLLFVGLPFETAFKMSIILQVLLAAAGTWLTLRDIGCSRTGAILGAAVFGFSGYMVSLGNLLNLLDSAAFMPLTVWLAGRALARGFAPWGSLAAISLAVQVMAGEPAILLCTIAAIPALHWSRGGAAEGGRARPVASRFAVLIGIFLLALSLAMVAVIPTAELLARSERGSGFDPAEALKWSLSPVTLLEAAVPRLFGDPTRAGITRFWGGGLFDSGLPFILSIYLGPGALILACFAIHRALGARGARRAEALALAGLAVAGIALALGRFLPLYPALLAVLPPLEAVRYPVKYFLLAAWAVALLAARGYDAISEAPRGAPGRGRLSERRGPIVMAVMALIAGVALSLGARWMGPGRWLRIPEALVSEDDLGIIQRGIDLSALWASGAAASCCVILLLPLGRPRRVALAAIVIADLLMNARGLNPTAPASFYSEPSATAGLAGAPDGGGRIWATPRPKGFAFRAQPGPEPDSLRWGFRWDRMTLRNATYFPLGYRFAFDRGNERLDVMPGAAVARLLATQGHEEHDGHEGRAGARPEALARLLSLAGVDRIICYGGLDVPGFAEAARLEGESNIPVVVMKSTAALPRVFIVHRREVIPEPGEALRRLDDMSFDPERTVILEQGPHTVPQPAPGQPSPFARARILEDRPTRLLVEAETEARGWLVLTDTFYPGWKARVDGGEVLVIRANAMFRAVPVEAGRHEVEFRYAPTSVRTGLMVTAAALLLAGLLAIPRGR